MSMLIGMLVVSAVVGTVACVIWMAASDVMNDATYWQE